MHTPREHNMHLYFSAILWCIVCVEIIMLWTEMQLLSCGSNEYLTPVEFIWPNNATWHAIIHRAAHPMGDISGLWQI